MLKAFDFLNIAYLLGFNTETFENGVEYLDIHVYVNIFDHLFRTSNIAELLRQIFENVIIFMKNALKMFVNVQLL